MSHRRKTNPSDSAGTESKLQQDRDRDYGARATGRLSALNIDHTQAQHTLEDHRKKSRWIVGGYLLASVLWILFTDTAVELLIDAPELRAQAQTIKGIAFITLSSGFIFFLITRHFSRIRRVEKQLRQRDTFVGRIIDTMANGVALIDLDGTVVDVNPALADMFGANRDSLIGQSLDSARISTTEPDSTADDILDRARTEGQWSGELSCRHSDGHHVPVHLTLAPLSDEQGELTGFVGDYLDLRALKNARAQLDGLGEVIEQLATETDVEVVGKKAVTAAVQLTGSDLGGVVLTEPDHGQFFHRWRCGFGDALPEQAHKEPIEDHKLADRIVEVPRPQVFEEFDSSAHGLSSYHRGGARTLAAVPLTIRGITRGALVVATTESRSAYNNQQIQLLEAISRQIGVAIHRHELLQEARRSETRFRNVVNAVPDILYKASLPEFETQFISPSVEQILGAPIHDFLANPRLWRDLIHDEDRQRVTNSIKTVIADPGKHRYSVQYRSWNSDRTRIIWCEDRGRIERDDQGRPVAIIGSVSDVTSRKKAEDRLAFLAFHDRLTALPNRLGLLEELDERVHCHSAATGILLYCDLDGFHLINDIYGHDCGNNLLVEAARRLEDTLPDNTTVSRIGADEFVAFIPVDEGDRSTSDPHERKASTSFLEAMARGHCEQVMAAFKRPFSIRNQDSYVSTTIGIGLLTPDLDDSRTLLKNAHRALAHAKSKGPANFAFYAGELALRQQRRLSLQSRLHRAIEQQQFTLHYQPLIDLNTGAIIGAEALLRWTTEDGERISPGEFIPVAEDSGLIIPLGDWVLHRACRDLRSWRDDGLDLRVSLNLSPHQFFHLDIVDRVESAVRDAGLSPEYVELELTETAMLVDPDETAQTLGRLRAVGFSVAIDDFGTGYSSLDRLKQLPVETLKIDRSFVSDLPGTSRDASIVLSVVTLSKNFSMDALAEGIETREQWQWLRSKDCPYGQGYYFSRPLPEPEFRSLCNAPPPWLDSDDTLH